MLLRRVRMWPNFIVPLCIGILLGFGLSNVLQIRSTEPVAYTFCKPLRYEPEGVDPSHPDEDKLLLDHSPDEEIHNGSDLVAQKLAKKVRILCWILTNPDDRRNKAIHVKRTWGRRCDKLLFMSSREDPTLPTIALPNVKEGRDYLWAKTKEAFKYVYEHHLHEADWFMKADDDSYVILENLRYMLKDKDKSSPVYYGFRLKPNIEGGYMSGGAGYVLSKEALKRFVEKALPSTNSICRQDHGGFEDLEMRRCLKNVGVEAGDSRDNLGRSRFHAFPLIEHIVKGYVDISMWFYYPHKWGFQCCSDTAITFHYIQPKHMYLMEYLIYHVRPYGISSQFEPSDTLPSNSTGDGTVTETF